jgi:NitT/TauT family transport system ATP-binding protein
MPFPSAAATGRLRGGVSVRLEKVRRAFADLVVINDISLQVDAGEFLAILGPSGCGKSTLLRIIAGLAAADSGTLSLDPSHDPYQTGYVFQDAHLLPWRNVLDNAALPLELMGAPRADRTARARQELANVGLSDAEDRYPAQLSGGMRMRVSLARALVAQPRLLLLDEPFAALDEITRFRLDVQLRELWIGRGMTVIFVTHSISEAASWLTAPSCSRAAAATSSWIAACRCRELAPTSFAPMRASPLK